MKKRSIAGRIIRVILTILLIVVVILGIGVGLMTVAEYRPEDTEALEITGAADREVSDGEAIRLVTWNVGYGALGNNADFFMDGGKGVHTADEERVNENVNSMIADLQTLSPDIILLQEVDEDATRSHHIDETVLFSQAFPKMQSTFGYNYIAAYVPYPIPPLGKIRAGIQTLSGYAINSAERISLPCPFAWPVRTVNLKRCLVVNRIPIIDSPNSLVIINLHLEAYDSGEGKEKQTAMLRDILEAEAAAGNYVIAGGDFNQIFSGQDKSAYEVQEGMWAPGEIDESAFPSDWQFMMDSRRPTCRSLDKPFIGVDRRNFQYYLIDGFIVSSNITVTNLETINRGFKASDHNPVVLDIVLGEVEEEEAGE